MHCVSIFSVSRTAETNHILLQQLLLQPLLSLIAVNFIEKLNAYGNIDAKIQLSYISYICFKIKVIHLIELFPYDPEKRIVIS